MTCVVASRPRGSIRAVGSVGLVLILTVTMMMMLVLVRGEAVLIRGWEWKCCLGVRCRRVVRCLRSRFRSLGGR